MCTVLLPPGVNPIAVNKYINMGLNGNGLLMLKGRLSVNDELERI